MSYAFYDEETILIPELNGCPAGTARRFSHYFTAYDITSTSWLTDDAKKLDEILKSNDDVVCYVKMTKEEALNLDYEWYQPDGLEDSFIGVVLGVDKRPLHGLFSYAQCVKIMADEIDPADVSEDETPESIAIESLEYNTLGAWVGEERTPFFLDDYNQHDFTD